MRVLSSVRFRSGANLYIGIPSSGMAILAIYQVRNSDIDLVLIEHVRDYNAAVMFL